MAAAAANTRRAPDALTRYRAKRDFAITPEPAAGGKRGKAAASFVIQKHWASSLHYDFRLELDGTMKSWAVPKGPSLDPKVKRMAVHVEDHPIAYASFEGTIPAKQYGAGKVIIWDNGTWHPLGDAGQGYRDGNLKFELRGHKLRGRWVLIRMKGKGEKQEPWLLIKEKDEFARAADEYSVVDALPASVAKLSASPAKPGPAAPANSVLPAGAVEAALPPALAPQLATLVDGPPPDPARWIFEIKFDGYRLLARIDGADIRLCTRNGNDWTKKLLPLRASIAKLKLPAGWYDGEIVVTNERGVPDFGALQQAFDAKAPRDVVLYLFDLPYFDGHDLRGVPLEARRALLQRVLADKAGDAVRFSEEFAAPPNEVVSAACKLGLEGVIAKRRDSTYVSRRSADWIKLKCSRRQEFVIGGYTEPQGARVGIGALLLGVHDADGALRYAGKVGTGFDDRTLAQLQKQLAPLRAQKSPFAHAATIEGRPHWVKPTLVAEVSFGEWTRSGSIRHSVFHGLRSDKPAKAIVREKAAGVKKAAGTKKAAPAAGVAKSHALSTRLRVTHPDRVIDASTGFTKLDLVNYYASVGELMLPHLAGRPVSLVRAPSGVGGALFFQKHAETEKLPGVRQLAPTLDAGHPPMLEVAGKEGLLSAAQWNVVEFHTQNAVAKDYAHPDRMVFDLDPGTGVKWGEIQEAAELVHAFLTQLGLPAFLKTSGGKGLHVAVPLRRTHDWDTVKGFAQAIVAHLAATIPKRFVAKSGPGNRVGKIFIDYLRNGQGATTVCAWSARARPGLGVSVPVEWRELDMLTAGDHWNARNAGARFATGNKPWAAYAKSARSLAPAMKALGYPARDDS